MRVITIGPANMGRALATQLPAGGHFINHSSRRTGRQIVP